MHNTLHKYNFNSRNKESATMQYTLALLLVAIVASVSAFSLNSRITSHSVMRLNSGRARSSLLMAEDSEPEFKPEDPKLFDMNRITRLGRSRDQVKNAKNRKLIQYYSELFRNIHTSRFKLNRVGWQIKHLVNRAKDGCCG